MSRIQVAGRSPLLLPGRPSRDRLVLPGFAVHGTPHRGMELANLRALRVLPGIAGGDRGIQTEADALTTTADGRDLNDVWAEFQRVLSVWNTQRQAIVNFLTFSVTEPVENVPQVPTVDFEEASEFGEPKRIRGVSYFSFGYDFRWFDIGIGYTWKYLLSASASQLQAVQNQVLEADNRLIFSRVLKAIFNNVNRTVTMDTGAVYNVYPFYNNDGTTPPPWKNTTHTSTHQHYLTSGAAAPTGYDSADIATLETHLTHHGYGAVQGSRLVLMFNSANSSAIKAAVRPTWQYDFIPSSTQPPWLATTGVQGGGQPPGLLAGLNVVGSYGNFIVLEDDWMPANYILAFATGGSEAADNPVGVRENPRARGLRLVKGRDPDYPLINSFYNRGLGTGVRKRGAGAVMEITADATYDIPAAYV
jgi:hypothetical protein